MAWLIGEAVEHPGYAPVDVLQPCVTLNRSYAYDFYNERAYRLEDEEGYDPTDRTAAWEKAQEWGERIPIGILYRGEATPTYEEQGPALKAGPPVQQPLDEGWIRRAEALKQILG